MTDEYNWDEPDVALQKGTTKRGSVRFPADATVRHQLEPWRRALVRQAAIGRYACALEESGTKMRDIANVALRTQCHQMWGAVEETISHSPALQLWAEAIAAQHQDYAGNGGWLLEQLLARLPVDTADPEEAALARDHYRNVVRQKLPVDANSQIVDEYLTAVVEGRTCMCCRWMSPYTMYGPRFASY